MVENLSAELRSSIYRAAATRPRFQRCSSHDDATARFGDNVSMWSGALSVWPSLFKRICSMRYIKNEIGKEFLLLQPGDSLNEIPLDYRPLVTPLLESVFADPRTYFDLTSAATPIKNLSEYLKQVIQANQWSLIMDEQWMRDGQIGVGFRWYCDGLFPITFSLPSIKCHDSRLSPLYEYFGTVNWGGFGFSGEILPLDKFIPLHDYTNANADVFSLAAQVFATTISGDFFVIDQPDVVGITSHEDGSLHRFDGFLDCCEWIFNRMLHNTPPEFPYDVHNEEGRGREEPFQLRVVRPDDD